LSKNHDKIKGQFFPMFHETLESPAYKQLSFGARALLAALRKHCINNNGHVYLSQRDASKALGHKRRNDIANWYRELQHYGFIVQTEAASLGVDGKGKATHWRLTELPMRKGNNEFMPATKDFLRWDGTVFKPHVRPSRRWNPSRKTALKKQNPGLHVRTTVDSTSVPVLDSTSVPLAPQSGTHVESISAHQGGTHVESISRLATVVSGSKPKRRGGARAEGA
jgi:hypothetical protein